MSLIKEKARQEERKKERELERQKEKQEERKQERKAAREKKLIDSGLSKKTLSGGGERWSEDHPEPQAPPVSKNNYSHADFNAAVGDENAREIFESKDKNIKWFLELIRINGVVDFNDDTQLAIFSAMAGKVGKINAELVANVVGG